MKSDRENRIFGYYQFLNRWEDRVEVGSQGILFKKSLSGKKNLDGSEENFSSHLLTRWHPSFENSLEAGIRELVLQLVHHLDCVTYSSCEGHSSTSTEKMRVRNVRVITRSWTEHTYLRECLKHLAFVSNEQSDTCHVRLVCVEDSIIVGGGETAPSLDLIFMRGVGAENEYWSDLEIVYQNAVRHLPIAAKQNAPSTRATSNEASSS